MEVQQQTRKSKGVNPRETEKQTCPKIGRLNFDSEVSAPSLSFEARQGMTKSNLSQRNPGKEGGGGFGNKTGGEEREKELREK